MKVPGQIKKLIKSIEKQAVDLNSSISNLYSWLEENNIDTDCDTNTYLALSLASIQGGSDADELIRILEEGNKNGENYRVHLPEKTEKELREAEKE